MESRDSISRRIYWDQQPSYDLSLFHANQTIDDNQRHRPNQATDERNKRLKTSKAVDLGLNRQQPQPKANRVCCASNDQNDEVVVGGGGGNIGKDQLQRRVYTRRVPKDRRVRLSPTTAMQFFDLQDRLGYSRPSRAIDWLIAKARSAIDKLARPPPTAAPTEEMEMAGGDTFPVPNCAIHPQASPLTFQGFGHGLLSGSSNSTTEDLCLSLCTSEQTAPNRVSYLVTPSGVAGAETSFGSGPGPSRLRGPVAPNNNGGGYGGRYVFTKPPSSVGWSFQSSLLPSPTSLHGWDDLSIACGAAPFCSDGRVPVGQCGYGFGSEDKSATFSGPSGSGN